MINYYSPACVLDRGGGFDIGIGIGIKAAMSGFSSINKKYPATLLSLYALL
jgi:hypothetical protein